MRLIDSTAIPVVMDRTDASSINIPTYGEGWTIEPATYSYVTQDSWRTEYEKLHEEFLNLEKLLRSYGITGFPCSEGHSNDSADDQCIDEDLLDTMYSDEVEE